MKKREKRTVRESGKYRVVEMEIIKKETDEVVDVCYEVLDKNTFLVEFDNESEAIQQVDFLLGLDEQNSDPGPNM